MKRVYHPREFEIFNCLPHPVWVFDLDQESMWWANVHAVKLWNAESAAALLARDFSDTSEATKERLANYRRKFEKGETLTEQWTFYPKGEPRVVVISCSGVLIEEGRIALLAEGRPLSKADVDPNTLRCVEALHHTSLMVSIFSLEGELIFQNPAASRTFSHKADRFSDRFNDSQLARETWLRALSGTFISREAELHTKDGVRWHGIDCLLTRDPVTGDRVVLCNQRDLHTLMKTELELENAIIEAQQMAQTKSRFLANMSHEIRTPLNGVLGMAQLLGKTRLSTVQRQYVEHMRDAAHILHTLIDDILDYSKLEAGRLRLDPRSFSLHKCFKTCVALIDLQAKAKRLRFRAEYHAPADLFLLGDVVRITQVLINVLVNAVKFTHKGEVRFKILATVRPNGMRALRFTVVDTGIGISPEDQEKLFARFTQLDNSLRRGQAGTGLGLAICRELVGLMEGQLGLESEPGVGSTFTIDLQLPVVTAEARREAEEELETPPKRLEILLVEDNKTNQMVARRMLVKLGHRCVIANNGAEALETLRDYQPNLIFMDVVMPVMDGITATRKIRELEAGVRRTIVVALTANVMKEDTDFYRASDMDDFLPKPLSFNALRKILLKWQ